MACVHNGDPLYRLRCIGISEKHQRVTTLDVRTSLPHVSRVHRGRYRVQSAAHVIAAPARRVFTGACVHCVAYRYVYVGERHAGPAAVPQVKAILKVRFRFVSREFAACER